jgi:ribosome-binding factor A
MEEKKKDNRRHRQIADAIRDELSVIMRREISHPNIEKVGMITISGVDLAPDGRDATVWLSFMGKEEKAQDVQDALVALKNSSGFMHRLLIKRLPMKIHPKLTFKFDKIFDRAMVVNKALNEAAEVEKAAKKIKEENGDET